MADFDLSNALNTLRTQGVIAYPTESVFGLGCDPDCEIAIRKILDIKQRPSHKGLILIAANIEQLTKYADFSSLNDTQLNAILGSWPGPFTWVVPIQKKLSTLISGDFDSIAVRVCAHPVVQQLCVEFGKPIISTSANLSGLEACINAEEVKKMFIGNSLLTTIIEENVSGLGKPSQIHDAMSGQRLR